MMGIEHEIPENLIERVEMIEGLLTERATGGKPNNSIYAFLRRECMANDDIKNLLPAFVRTHRSLDAFWPFIQKSAETYAERRQIISNAFNPVMDFLNGRARAPIDETASDTLQSFDEAGVHEVWSKALARRANDPEGAITVARTLLETVCKRILDEMSEAYTDKEDLPKLYSMVASSLKLAPNQHTEEPIKAILGGAMTMVNGIGTLRNRMSDSHGRGGKLPVKPSERHATLAVNTAGALATFLVETYNARQSQPQHPSKPT